MNEVQNLLLQVIGAAMFGKKTPIVADNQILPLIIESNSQAELNEDSVYNCAVIGNMALYSTEKENNKE